VNAQPFAKALAYVGMSASGAGIEKRYARALAAARMSA